VAFFRYFWDVYNFSYQNADAGGLRSISTPKCSFCSRAIQELDAASKSGSTFEGGQVSVSTAVAAPGDARRGIVVNAVASQEPGRKLDSAGVQVTAYPSQNAVRVDAGVQWDGSEWRMLEVALLRPGEAT
jgi:hypothetical protein